jgi:hypothetical protein
MAGHAARSESIDAARNRFVRLVGRRQDERSATDACLVCGKPATWRIERPVGSYVVCDWCASIIREYDASHPEHHPSRHVRLASAPTPDLGVRSGARG